MPLKLKGSSSGDVTLDVPAAAGTNTLTLPARTGNIITSADTGTVTGTMLASATVTQSNLASNVAGNGPAFSAYASGSQSFSNSTSTKVQLNTIQWNLGGYYDNTTNYRFTPLVAGYYLVGGGIAAATGAYETALFIRKNNVLEKVLSDSNSGLFSTPASSAVVYLNGSSDYVELFYYQSSGGTLSSSGGLAFTFFQATLLRSA